MDWTLIIPFAAGGIRNIAGWLENSLKDGKIDKYEWGKLGGTVLEVAVLSFAAMFGLGLDPASASGVGILGSFVLSALKKIGAK
jgi:hypothetical protein